MLQTLVCTNTEPISCATESEREGMSGLYCQPSKSSGKCITKYILFFSSAAITKEEQ